MSEEKVNAEVEAKKDVEAKKKVINPLLYEFRKPYKFEGDEYKNLDLSGLDNITVKDMENVEREIVKKSGIVYGNVDYSTEAIKFYVSIATNHPVEFVESLPAKEFIGIKQIVISFLAL